MPFFPVDDDAAFHSKLRAAGNAAVGLWVRAGSYAMKEATNGVLQRHELEGLGKPAEARRLVEVVLWHAAGHDCERCEQPPAGGWVFHDWHDWGPLKSKEQIKDRREADRVRQRRKRSHDRHAVTPVVTPVEGRGGGPHSPGPSPYPSSSSVSQSGPSWLTRALDGLTNEDLKHIGQQLRCSTDHAKTVASQVLARSQTPVARPLAYIGAAIEAEPDRYRPTPGPPRKTDACPLPGHGSYPATGCGACRADHLAEGTGS